MMTMEYTLNLNDPKEPIAQEATHFADANAYLILSAELGFSPDPVTTMLLILSPM